MRTAAELLHHLRASGGRIALDGDDLDVEAPDDVLTDRVLEQIRHRKRDLVEILRAETVEPNPRAPGAPAPPSSSTAGAARAPRPDRPPVPERAEPALRAQLLAAAAERGFPAIGLEGLGVIVGRDGWARLAGRIGGLFLAEVLEEIRTAPPPRRAHRTFPLSPSGDSPR